MTQVDKAVHGMWSGRMAFVLAATGSAVGLGNIWKFPYMAGENGGGAFVLVYLLCILLIGLPIMIAEIMLGRRGGLSPVNTMRKLAKASGQHASWQVIGWFGLLAAFLILSFYSVIAGWVVSYSLRSAVGIFEGVTAEGASAIFGELAGDAEKQLAWHTIFMVMTAAVVARGVERGLEQAARWLMPVLFVLLVVMVGYAMTSGGFAEGANFLLVPDFSKITGAGIVAAMGHAFFSLSLGLGAIMMYGAYVPNDMRIIGAGISIAMADTVVALLAGLAIFPVVFANGLDPETGPTLIFQTLPLAFGQMGGGVFFSTLFFVLLTLAAWSSAISLIEPCVAWLVENRRMSRAAAAVLVAMAAWFLGIGTILSFNHWQELTLYGKTFFEVADFLTTNLLLPLGGTLIAVFSAWFLSREVVCEELGLKSDRAFLMWKIAVGVIAPLGVLVVFVSRLGDLG
ncbi:MAG: sodium-dependent transporter [Gammaproteobacteria bacterium]